MPRRKSRVLVSGGCGFLGSALVRELVAQGCEVIVLDKLTYAGRPENLEGVNDCELIEGDIADAGEILDSSFNAVFHLAAESHVDRSIESADEFLQTNILGTHAMLEACRQAWEGKKIPPKRRFIYVSTDEVYGPIAEPALATEESTFRPSSPYAASKAAADCLAHSYYKTHGMDVVIARLSNCYGPRQFPEKLIPLAISRLDSGDRVPIYGRGDNQRQWLWVVDAAKALMACWYNGMSGRAYNFGGDLESIYRNEAVIYHLCEAMEKRFEESILYVPDRKGHDSRYALSSALAFFELHWRPKMSLKRGLEQTVIWYRRNPEWVERCLNDPKTRQYMTRRYGRASE